MVKIKTYVLTLDNEENEILQNYISYYEYDNIEEYLKSVLLKELVDIESSKLITNLIAALSTISQNEIFTINNLIEQNSITIPKFMSLLHLDEIFEATLIHNASQHKVIFIDICEDTCLCLYKKVF